ncbi:MAG: glutathione S-transferase family protein [Alphaproteobacteria bacterium]
MKLYYIPTSPYARVVRAMAIETGLDSRMKLIETTIRDPESALLSLNPVGRVPTLVTEGGLVFGETLIICSYLDGQHDRRRMIPLEIPDHWEVLHLAGIAIGLLDGIVTYTRETRRPEEKRWDDILQFERARMDRCLSDFQERIADGLFDDRANLAEIILGCALGFAELRLPEIDWRRGRPDLSRWYDDFAARPTMQKTAPPA